MNIVLIGFMGSGKTTIGSKLARRLGYYFLDMDAQIESEQGCSVREIFNYAGEAHFRALETQLLKRLIDLKNTVISTGGGVVTMDGNLGLMKQIGKLIYLKVPLEELLHRLKQDTKRPLLQSEDAEQKIRALLQQRSPLYEQADYIIEANQTSPQIVTTQIIQVL